MSFKSTALVITTVASLATASLQAVTPETSGRGEERRLQEQTSQLSDSQAATNAELRREGRALGEANYLEQFRPVEPVPRERLPLVRLFLP